MPLMRNPFRSRPSDLLNDENAAPTSYPGEDTSRRSEKWTGGSIPMPKGTAPDFQPREYKLSEIDDSGQFIPPSPTETKSSFWSTRSGASTRSSSHRSVLNNDCEPFNISRESFDSYRRSFDISARLPVVDQTPQRPRQSLDARRMRQPSSLPGSPPLKQTESSSVPKQLTRPLVNPYQPRVNSLPDNHVNPPSAQPEESEDVVSQQMDSHDNTALTTGANGTNTKSTPADTLQDRFEDVTLGESADSHPSVKKTQVQQSVKKPSIFSRFGSTSTSTASHDGPSPNPTESRPNSSAHSLGLGMFGRKRGQSGQGSELGSLPGSGPQTNQIQAKKGSISANTPEVKPEGHSVQPPPS